ncbi:MAG: sialate O-acetylesterase [Actinomycetes bacterium]
MIVGRMKTALALMVVTLALVTLVVAAAAPPAPAAAPGDASLRLVSPRPYQIFQRGDDGRGDILVAGRAVGLGSKLEARWGDEPWAPFACRANGAFALRLRARPAGQATLQVRAAARPEIVVSRPYVGVGDIYVVAGQSNASGRGTSPNWYTHPVLRAALFGNDDRWKELLDPVDGAAGQVDRVSADPLAGGSVWPLLATELMAAEGVPVAFVPCAKGTTPIGRWVEDAWAPHSRSTLYGSMLRRVRAVGGRVRAVLFWQGEADARRFTSQEAYAAALRSLAAALAQDCGAPLVAAQIGDYDARRYTREGIDAIRLAQQEAWRAGWALAGPALYDIDLHGRAHFIDWDDELVAARRWVAAVLSAVLHREAPAAPRLKRARYDGGLTVTLRFDCGGDALRPGEAGGLVVRAAGDPLQVTASVTATDTVTLLLAAPALLPLTVSLGSGREAAGRPVPVEASLWALPAEVFIDAPVVTVAE